MMKARSDALPLAWRNWATDEGKVCPLCLEGVESLEHFLLKCDRLETIRSKCSVMQRPRNNDANVIKQILLFNRQDSTTGKECLELLWKMWSARDAIIKIPI